MTTRNQNTTARNDLKAASSRKKPMKAPAAKKSPDLTDDSAQRALTCARAVIDKKAERVKLLYLGEASGFTDYFVICSAMSDRQVAAIADEVEKQMRETHRVKPLSVEGLTDARWVLLDYGDVVVHIFIDALRDYYNLDGLWSDAERVAIPSEFYGASVTREERA